VAHTVFYKSRISMLQFMCDVLNERAGVYRTGPPGSISRREKQLEAGGYPSGDRRSPPNSEHGYPVRGGRGGGRGGRGGGGGGYSGSQQSSTFKPAAGTPDGFLSPATLYREFSLSQHETKILAEAVKGIKVCVEREERRSCRCASATVRASSVSTV